MGLGLALAGIGALAKVATGIGQGIKANKLEKQTIRPVEQVQNEYYQNVADAQLLAQQGMPAQAYNNATQNIQRNQQGVLRVLGRSAAPGGLASILRQSNDATLNLDVNDANMRVQNQRFLMGQRSVLAGQKKEAFDWNEKSKYLATAARIQALRGGAAQNLMGGFSDVSQIGAMMENPESAGGMGGNAGGMFSGVNSGIAAKAARLGLKY